MAKKCANQAPQHQDTLNRRKKHEVLRHEKANIEQGAQKCQRENHPIGLHGRLGFNLCRGHQGQLSVTLHGW